MGMEILMLTVVLAVMLGMIGHSIEQQHKKIVRALEKIADALTKKE